MAISSSSFIPGAFVKSCQAHEQYPRKLIGRSRHGVPLLDLYRDRFRRRIQRQNMFVDESKVYVPYLDVLESGSVQQAKLLTKEAVAEWLGGNFQRDPQNASSYLDVKPDPRCRFIFLITAGSIEPLELTPKTLQQILSYLQVMPAILDFLYCFGGRDGEDRELRFSGFRTEKTMARPNSGLVLNALNRSGKRFQMCYNLKTVAVKEVDHNSLIDMTWKIRQAVIHHQFDIETGTQSWVIADPLGTMEELTREHIHGERNQADKFGTFIQSFQTSLETHLTFAGWAVEEWRWHIESSEGIIEKITSYFVDGSGLQLQWNPQALALIQQRDEKIRETVMALESNTDILTRLRDFYANLVKDIDFPDQERSGATHAVNDFISRVDEHVYDCSMQAKRAKALLALVSERKQILIQHLQAQTAARQEDLTGRQEKLANRAGIEAIAVRIITVITLIYLPATFVSTFFSTDAVDFSDSTSPGDPAGLNTEGSHRALKRFFEVSVPLMAVTFGLAAAWFYHERRQMRKQFSATSAIDKKQQIV
ncbi:hypothetical protein F5Y15DRAFT_415751 [Xylariaceae sp. FL0016]|nr:hypothetical protein F5Y15DRAFT_415751 [Xylariaceae sp. FL0016]